MSTSLSLGLDIGSTTVKLVVQNAQNEIIYSDYQRHLANINQSISKMLRKTQTYLTSQNIDAKFQIAITGSAGMGIAQETQTCFVQEVIAETETINQLNPEADVIIELGGEDAKITYLHPIPEQRMNGSCAGGTGSFIDQMAILLKTDAAGLNDLAQEYQQLYTIASRCGVFAKSDLQPLINDGAAHTDLAASIFQAVATQVIAGLACGRPIKGNIIFLGGPLHFLPELRAAFKRALGDKVDRYIIPGNAQLYVAIGAAMLAQKKVLPENTIDLADFIQILENSVNTAGHFPSLPPLFANSAELEEFKIRHNNDETNKIVYAPIEKTSGRVFLGIDAGSTTIKTVLIDDKNRIIHSSYQSNQGDPIKKIRQIIGEIYELLPKSAIIARVSTTGYGEGLIKAAISADEGNVETVAHYEAANFILPGVNSIIDIGGQDMKFIKVLPDPLDPNLGVIDSIQVNEACSSGCGSFLETFAQTMNLDISEFTKAALESQSPVDLGSRCTVFMNSAVKQAQKAGAKIGDIAAGLSYSVVKNALYKVIKLRDATELGTKVVAQGGTFLSDAVLRAFEKMTGLEIERPEIAGLMGAYGSALLARKHYLPGAKSKLIGALDLRDLQVSTEMKTCPLCPNKCKMTLTYFSRNGKKLPEPYITGNRCERGGDAAKKRNTLPDLFEYKYQRTFAYRPLKNAPRGKIGIPRVLNMFENYPFWFTLLTNLGFEVVLSRRSNHELFESGMDSIASENICYPAKLAHGHVKDLLDKGIDRIFYPCITFEANMHPEADNDYNCPIVANYPQVIANNMEELHGNRAASLARENEVQKFGFAKTATVADSNGIDFIFPYFSLRNPEHLAKRIYQEFHRFGISLAEAKTATKLAFAEDGKYKNDIFDEGQKAIEYASERDLDILVLAGRPYHVDPEINHGIPQMVTSLGMVVLSEDAAAGIYDRKVSSGEIDPLLRPLRVMDQWTYHSCLYKAAALSATNSKMQFVQLNSFGCGLDAVTTDQAAEILAANREIYTVLKIDEVSNLGAAKIRLRSLQEAALVRANQAKSLQKQLPAQLSDSLPDSSSEAKNLVLDEPINTYGKTRRIFTKPMRQKHTLICPQMHPVPFRLLESVFNRAGFNAIVLETASKEDIEAGLKYVNNDACYPAIMIIGQLINALESGKFDPENTSIAITQTGGMCRATNYVSLLRLGLHQAGFSQVPVVAISTQGLEKNPGFKLTIPDYLRVFQALIIGDLLQELILRVRPYEKNPGETDRVYEEMNIIAKKWLGKRGFRISYSKMVRKIVKAFDEIELRQTDRLPRIGVVGEILVKFHPDANNQVLKVIESENCEAVLPGMLEFMINKLYIADWNWRNIARGSFLGRIFKPISGKLIEFTLKPIHKAYSKSSIYQGKRKFQPPAKMADVVAAAKTCTSVGVQAGEGWLLAGEIITLLEDGAQGIVCANPFACLPNHVTGRGIFYEIRKHHSLANIVSIDYDPGASEVNQLNRIKLMVAAAKSNSPQ